MTRPSARTARTATALLLATVLGVLSGCVSLPVDGPVVETRVTDAEDARRASDIDPLPPASGASRAEVVAGFLDAMTAWPIDTSVARQYLTTEAAAAWKPERETVVYADPASIRESGGIVDVQFTSADTIDEVGGWRGALTGDELTMSLRVAVEHGEFRIVDPRDALVVPATWFQQRYQQVSLFYFDPIAQILVPEPVFVPQGEQFPTSLVSALLAGPPPLSRAIVRSFVPKGLSVGLSVPVDEEGVARVDLVGDAPRLTAEEAELLLAQLSWTLRQDDDITAIRVTIGGQALPLPGGASTYPVEEARAFAPAGADASGLLFGVSRGRLVWGSPGNLVVVPGPFGDQDAGVVAVGARPDAEVVAVVDAGGRRVRVGPVRPAPDDEPRTVLSGGRYARPTWDVAGRLWVLEPRPAGARVWLVERGVAREVAVPGVTGTDARLLVASRDGTRLVAVVRTAAGDQVTGARVVINGRGRVLQVRSPFLVRPGEGTRIDDIAWSTPIRVALLTATAPGTLYEVDVVAADGAAVGVDLLSTIVSGRLIGIAATPTADAPVFAVYADRYVDLAQQEEIAVDQALTQLDFVG